MQDAALDHSSRTAVPEARRVDDRSDRHQPALPRPRIASRRRRGERRWAHQLESTIADLLKEMQNTTTRAHACIRGRKPRR